MEFTSTLTGRKYEINEAVEPRQTKSDLTSDILVIFDWNTETAPIFVGYLFGATFLDEMTDDIQDVISSYEKENDLV